MVKKLFIITIYSALAFIVITFFLLIFSMILNKINGTFPNFSMGFPFKIYEQFLINENGFHHGISNGFLPNCLIIWISVFLVFQLKENKFKLL